MLVGDFSHNTFDKPEHNYQPLQGFGFSLPSNASKISQAFHRDKWNT